MAGVRLVELSELKSWTGQREERGDVGYTPPEVLGGTPRGAVAEWEDAPVEDAEDVGVVDGEEGTGSESAAPCAEADVVTRQIQRALDGEDGSPVEELDGRWGEENREEIFRACLGASVVDVDELRRIVWAHGVPDRPWARPLAWKLLAGYLPPDRVDWEVELAARRAEYWALVADVTVDPSEKGVDGDHPLNDAGDSQWGEFFKDVDLRAVIDRDVQRTHPGFHRFERLRDSLERLLFAFAKTHPALGYRQGMNELAAPLMLVFSDAPFEDLSNAEADAYFCFERIMSEMGTCYAIQETAGAGIGKQLRELQALLRIKDPGLESHLTRCGIDPRFFGLRWVRLWLSQEFELLECLRLWDSLLTSELRLPWLRYVCVAMIIRIREDLLHADFAGCMKLLLHYPPCDVAELLRIADRLRTSNVIIVRSVARQ